jgi:hypothetical protein
MAVEWHKRLNTRRDQSTGLWSKTLEVTGETAQRLSTNAAEETERERPGRRWSSFLHNPALEFSTAFLPRYLVAQAYACLSVKVRSP